MSGFANNGWIFCWGEEWKLWRCNFMSKKLPRKYLSENAVKRALKIDSFRNLSKDKIMQFASMIPYMDKEVAIAIIS